MFHSSHDASTTFVPALLSRYIILKNKVPHNFSTNLFKDRIRVDFVVPPPQKFQPQEKKGTM